MANTISNEEYQGLSITNDTSLELISRVPGLRLIVPDVNKSLKFYIGDMYWHLKSLKTVTSPNTRQQYLEAVVQPNEEICFFIILSQPLFPIQNNAVDRTKVQILVEINNMENFENHFNFFSSDGTAIDVDNVGNPEAVNRYKKVLDPDNHLLVIRPANEEIFGVETIYVKKD